MSKMSDTISRQDAIDIVVFECGKWSGLAKEISKQLKQLPSAQPAWTTEEVAEILANLMGDECAIKKMCNVRPEWGEHYRYNCPMFVRGEAEND